MKGRYFLEIAYCGSNYHGWQVQDNALTIQEVLESCIEKILRKKIPTTASGRTDTGVHALQQFVHLDVVEMENIEKKDFLYKLNAILPWDIAVKNMFKVNDDAHARFSVYSRSYHYRMHTQKNPFLEGFSCFYPYRFNLDLMNETSSTLLGNKDFSSFSRVKTAVSNFECNVTQARWSEHEGRYLFSISANRFLRGMVRAIVGSLVEVGKGAMHVRDFMEMINSKDRREAGRSMPACGLYLASVKYPDHILMER